MSCLKFFLKIVFSILFLVSFRAQASATQTAILAGGCFWGMEEVFR